MKRRIVLLATLLLALSVACVSNTAGPTSAVAPADTTASPIAAIATQSSATNSPPSRCTARDGLPDASCTPGVADPRVTQVNIATTICKPGYSTSVRPPTSVTSPIKAERMAAYGYNDAPANYELDHLISLELGGHPSDVKNLWPEPYSGDFNARQKDQLENKLHDLVCAGRLTLAQAQQAEATDWRAAWTKYVGQGAAPSPRATAAAVAPTTVAPLSVFYENCTGARAAGAAPNLPGSAGISGCTRPRRRRSRLRVAGTITPERTNQARSCRG